MKLIYEKAGRHLLIAIIFLVSAACATTRVTSDWREESYQKKPEKILVLALLNETTRQRLVEDQLAGQLKESGIHAIAGYTVLPEGKPADREVLSGKVRELGADALLMTKLVDRKTVREYVPGTPYYPPTAYRDWYSYYGGFYPGYSPGYAPGYPHAYTPGYTTETLYNIAEANLYDAATGKIVWSAVTETEMRGNDEKAIKTYASKIVKSLRKQGLVP
jgi:hypothetical protein